MTQGSRMLFVDPLDRVGAGLKIHVYDLSGTHPTRKCGTHHDDTTPSKSDLRRISVDDYVADVNHCDACLSAMGLDDYTPSSSGADSVDADPFGVFNDDTDDRDDDPGVPWTGHDDSDVTVLGDDVEDVTLEIDASDVDTSSPLADGNALEVAAREYTGSFTVDADDLSDDDLVLFLRLFYGIPPALSRYPLARTGTHPNAPTEGTLQRAVFDATPVSWMTARDIRDGITGEYDGHQLGSVHSTLSMLVSKGLLEKRQPDDGRMQYRRTPGGDDDG